ncbi:MAG: tetratricopeptide repeat protein [Rhodoferax sp.]|nr:tetratricopeptide repeat protein [Rhodoferax sp.]
MKLKLSLPSPLEYFGYLVQDDAEFPLFEAALAVAQDVYPDVDLGATLDEVDKLLERLRRRVADDAPDAYRLQALNRFFYADLGFAGNLNNFHDPDNSFLSVVLRTRRGIPVSLGLLWMQLAQGLRLDARGVNFPGHFLVKVNLPKGVAVLDPLTGRSLSRDALTELLEPVLSMHQADGGDAVLASYLQTARARDVVARLLRNLKEIYWGQQDWVRLLAVQERMVLLMPQTWSEYRDRGWVHAKLGNHRQASFDLDMYLAHGGRGSWDDSLHPR